MTRFATGFRNALLPSVLLWAVIVWTTCSLAGCVTAPISATTLAAVEQSATLTTQAADTYVLTANPSPATRALIGKASNDLHAAVVSLEAQPAGTTLDLSAFNAALAALSAAGVPVKAPTP